MRQKNLKVLCFLFLGFFIILGTLSNIHDGVEDIRSISDEKLGKSVFNDMVVSGSVFDSPVQTVSKNHLVVDHTSVSQFNQIPLNWINQAKDTLHIVYQHTSHGSQLVTGMNALQDFPLYEDTYEWSDDGSNGLDLDDYGIPGCADLSQGDWIDEYGVTPWVTATRNLLDDPLNAHINVVMWSWCSINGHNINRYLDNMEILISEYPTVVFVFMTGHAEGQGEGGYIHTANEQIRQHCIDYGRILFDFADIENYDPSGDYYYDRPMWDDLDYNPGQTNNWGAEWIDGNIGSELEQLTTGDTVDGYDGCESCAHSDGPENKARINCVLKGQGVWWMMARLAGWEQSSEPIALFTYEPLFPLVSEDVFFTDLSIDNDGILINWSWDFGDGTNSYQQHPNHQYNTPDEYQICLTVRDDDGHMDSYCKIINVTNIEGAIDINQSFFDRGFPIRHALDGDWASAQSFIPTVDTLTSGMIYLRKFGNPEFDLTIELRENSPQGGLIDFLIFNPDQVPNTWEWIPLDFSDITVTQGIPYFIVIPPAPSGVTTSFGYEWGYAFGNQYDDGSFWFTRDGGALWRDLPTMYEFTFRTYGYI